MEARILKEVEKKEKCVTGFDCEVKIQLRSSANAAAAHTPVIINTDNSEDE